MIHLILIRHGRRLGKLNGHYDPQDQLAFCVHDEVRARAQDLKRLRIQPHQILTSRHQHARKTACILAKALGLSQHCDAPFLTPPVKKHPWYKCLQAKKCPICLDQLGIPRGSTWHNQAEKALRDASTNFKVDNLVLVWVGHEPRLSQIVLQFTGHRRRRLEALDAVCLTGADEASFTKGKACEAWRYPVLNWLEAEIKPKLESKMTVATLLASANFVAMLEILINKPAVLTLKGLDGMGKGKPWFPPWLCNQIESF